MGETWRLLVDDEPSDGAWNMAVDRAMQLAHAAGRAPATLRLYCWAAPTVTLGRFQAVETVDLDACRELGIDVARRFTGGRGVLHDDEVTYSVVAGTRDGVPRGTTASYRFLCRALVDAYGRLGVGAGLTSRPRGARASGACYLHATHADVSVGALKLSGSAQVWHRDSVLQHGSFVVSRDTAREAAVFGLSAEESQALALTTSTLSQLVSPVLERGRIAEAIAEAFGSTLGVHLEPSALSEDEREDARCLVQGRVVFKHDAAPEGASA